MDSCLNTSFYYTSNRAQRSYILQGRIGEKVCRYLEQTGTLTERVCQRGQICTCNVNWMNGKVILDHLHVPGFSLIYTLLGTVICWRRQVASTPSNTNSLCNGCSFDSQLMRILDLIIFSHLFTWGYRSPDFASKFLIHDISKWNS